MNSIGSKGARETPTAGFPHILKPQDNRNSVEFDETIAISPIRPLLRDEGSKHKDVGNDDSLSPEGLGMIQGVQSMSGVTAGSRRDATKDHNPQRTTPTHHSMHLLYRVQFCASRLFGMFRSGKVKRVRNRTGSSSGPEPLESIR